LIAQAAVLLRDAARSGLERVVPPPAGVSANALDNAVAWLCRTHDVTGRRGSSKGFSLLRGWLPAYPETTGYVLGTLLAVADRQGGRPELVRRAREMGDWETEIQSPDGGIKAGDVAGGDPRSIVFNTGMVLHGWIDLAETGYDDFDEAAARAARFLIDTMRADGTWRPEAEYGGIPHTYNSRVAWALLRWARRSGEDDAEVAARRQLAWACSRQRANGWFDDCVFRVGMTPSTHGIAYTLRGLLESHAITGEERWLHVVERCSEFLARKLASHPCLPANYDEDWRAGARHSCLTGTVQLGGVWLRLYQITGDARWLHAGLRAVEQAAARQETVRWPPVRGALAGSFPVWGRYAPLQYPNWATKFLADSLLLYEDCLVGTTPNSPPSSSACASAATVIPAIRGTRNGRRAPPAGRPSSRS
jgi:hypothetical protein